VDRGALDAALERGRPCGGWCPDGRLAEDGVIASRYPLVELPGGSYIERTRRNVVDSDGTLVVTFGPATGGTARTIDFCRELGKPMLLLDAQTTTPEIAASQAAGFVSGARISRLNVAGPRASGEPRAHAWAFRMVSRLLDLLEP
jgi:hypothetical protein